MIFARFCWIVGISRLFTEHLVKFSAVIFTTKTAYPNAILKFAGILEIHNKIPEFWLFIFKSYNSNSQSVRRTQNVTTCLVHHTFCDNADTALTTADCKLSLEITSEQVAKISSWSASPKTHKVAEVWRREYLLHWRLGMAFLKCCAYQK